MLPPYKTEWLIYFHCLIEKGAFAEAAESLAISPQNLRHNIKQLETALGAPLLERGSARGLTLTPAGELFTRQSRELLQLLDGLKRDFSPPQRRTLGCLLRYTPYLSLLDSAQGLNLFDYDLVTGFNRTEQVREALLNQRIEAGFLSEPLKESGFSCRRLQITGRIWGAAPDTRPWPELDYIRYHGLDQPQDLFWPEADYPREVVAESSSLEVVKALCMLGQGVLYLPDSLAHPEAGGGLLQPLAEAPFRLPPLYFVRHDPSV